MSTVYSVVILQNQQVSTPRFCSCPGDATEVVASPGLIWGQSLSKGYGQFLTLPPTVLLAQAYFSFLCHYITFLMMAPIDRWEVITLWGLQAKWEGDNLSEPQQAPTPSQGTISPASSMGWSLDWEARTEPSFDHIPSQSNEGLRFCHLQLSNFEQIVQCPWFPHVWNADDNNTCLAGQVAVKWKVNSVVPGP